MNWFANGHAGSSNVFAYLTANVIFQANFSDDILLTFFFFISVAQHAASFLIFTWDDVFESCYTFETYTNFVLHSCEMKITNQKGKKKK